MRHCIGAVIVAALMVALSAPCFSAPKNSKPSDWHEPEAIRTMLDQKEQEWGLPRGMAHCQAYMESRFSAAAVSPDGLDRGLMQINKEWQGDLVWRYFRNPDGTRRYGFQWDNPEHSATVGCAYLAAMIRVYGASDWLGLVAYNWGPGNLSGVKEWDDIPPRKRVYADGILALLDGLNRGWK